MFLKKSLRIAMVFALLVVLGSLFIKPPVSYAKSDANVTDWIQDGDQNSKPPAAEPDNTKSAAVGLSIWDYVKTIFALVFVVGILFAILKFLNKRNLKYQQNQIVQNLGGLSLGSQKSVQLLQIGDTLLLVGVGEDIQLLREITDPEQKEKILNLYSDRQEVAAASPYITELLGKIKKNSSSEKKSEESDKTLFSDVLEKKLSDIKKERSNELEKWKSKETDES